MVRIGCCLKFVSHRLDDEPRILDVAPCPPHTFLPSRYNTQRARA